MESTQEPLDMNKEALETTTRILVHILQPLSRIDKYTIIEHLCDTFDVRQYDFYDY